MALAVVDLPEGFERGVGRTVAQILEIVLRGGEGSGLAHPLAVEAVEDAEVCLPRGG